MKITTTAGAIAAPLTIISGVIARKSPLPILSNALLQTRDGKLELKGSDLEIEITARTGIEADANITLDAKKLLSIIKTLPADAPIAFSEKESRITLKGGKSRFTLQSLPAADYPTITESADFGEAITLSQGKLKALLSQVSFAMAVQDIRYYLNGLLIETEGKEVRLVATDGHRLAFTSDTVDSELGAQSHILPAKIVTELERLLSDTDEPVSIRFASNQIRVDMGQIEIVSKLIEGKFPDYRRVIPKNDDVAVIHRQSWLGAIQRASMLAPEKTRSAVFHFSPGQLSIQAENAQNESSSDVLDIEYSGPEIRAGFNVIYLQDVLNNTDAESVEFHLKDANSSGAVKIPSAPNFVYVVMPMRI